MINIKDVNYVPIEYKVLAYKSLFSHSSEIIYARKISEFAVVLTDSTAGNVETRIYFESDKYSVQNLVKNCLTTDAKLEDLHMTTIRVLNDTPRLESLLEPTAPVAQWYDSCINITSMFSRNNEVKQ